MSPHYEMGNWSELHYIDDFRIIYFYHFLLFLIQFTINHFLRQVGAWTSLSLSLFLLTPSYSRKSELSDGCNLRDCNSSQITSVGAIAL